MRKFIQITYNNETLDIIVTHLLKVPPDPDTWSSDWDYYGYEELDWEFVDITLEYLYGDQQKLEIEDIILKELTEVNND